MKSRPYQLGAALLGCFGALHAAGLPATLAANDGTGRQTVAELAAARGKESLNLARADLGTRLELVAGTGAADKSALTALLRDDDPLGCRLPVGVTSMIMSLPKIEVLNRFNFINLTAGGKVTISVADTKLPADSPLWHPVDLGQEFSPGGSEVVACDLRSTEGRYVKLDFDVRTAGSIDTFGLFGLPTLANSPGVRRFQREGEGRVRYRRRHAL